MKKSSNLSQENKRLIKRYLTWCYKTTKEELDRIDRMFTQLLVDAYVLSKLEHNSEVRRLKELDKFRLYIQNKEEKALNTQ